MMFYILLLVQLVLIGGVFFLWFQLKNESGVAVAGMSGMSTGLYEDFEDNTRSSALKQSKAPRFGYQKDQNQGTAAGLENGEWEKFGVMERKKEEREDFSDMDQMFGFGGNPGTGENSSANYDDFDDFSDEKPEVKKPSIEEEFADLFTEDELQEDRGYDSILGTQSVNDSMGSGSDLLNDFELDNSSTSSTDFMDSEEERKQEQDPLDFLRNYQFAEPVNEGLTDDIFEQARNRKDEFNFNFNQTDEIDNQEDGLIFEDEEDLDIDLMKQVLPPLEGINHNKSEETGIVLEPTPRTEDEEEDIFARFQSLQRMTDNMDDLK